MRVPNLPTNRPRPLVAGVLYAGVFGAALGLAWSHPVGGLLSIALGVVVGGVAYVSRGAGAPPVALRVEGPAPTSHGRTLELRPAPFRLTRVLEAARGVVAPAVERKGLQLTLEIDPSAPVWVLGDALRVRQVVLNLLANAIRFTPRGHVHLSARRLPEGQVAITVEDEGCGIDAAALEGLFRPYVGRHPDAGGLGLPISRTIARAMGGDVHGSSRRGVGSTFTFVARLPACEPPDALPEESPSPGVRLEARSPPEASVEALHERVVETLAGPSPRTFTRRSTLKSTGVVRRCERRYRDFSGSPHAEVRVGIVGVGRSFATDARRAAEEAFAAATTGLDGPPSSLIAFATAGYDAETVLASLGRLAPDAAVVGCSAEGVITQGRADELDYALGIMAIGTPELRGEPFMVPSYASDSGAAAAQLVREITARNIARPVALLVFTDGLTGDCTEFLTALADGLPWPIPIVGGAAGDALRMERTQQFRGREVATGSVSALLFHGRARATTYIGHGCRPIGLTKTVTRAEGGWVVELDGESAWEHFRSYLDGAPEDLKADGIMHLSVGQVLPGERGELAVRTPMLLRKSDGALFFPGGGLEVGAKLRMLRRDPQQISEDAVAVARRMLEDAEGRKPDFVLQFDCSGRGKLLFGSCAADELVRPVQAIVGNDVPWLGFHTYGEIATTSGAPRYHNYTVVLAPFYVGGDP